MEMTPIVSRSGNLRGGHYDPATQKLTVQFQSGAAYRYDCPPDLAREFMATWPIDESSGKFFHAKIRNALPVEKL